MDTFGFFFISWPCSVFETMELSQRLKKYLGKEPRIDYSVYLAESSELIGDVRLGKDCSIWPQAVLRADINSIEIDEGTNIQDGAIVHLADEYGVVVGRRVTVGHGAILHACTIEDNCLIGMRATILDGAHVGEGSIIGAHALITKGMKVPPRSLVLGVPAKVVRPVTDEEYQGILKSAHKYVQIARRYKKLETL